MADITEMDTAHSEKMARERFDAVSEKSFDIIADYVSGEKFLKNVALMLLYISAEKREAALEKLSDEMRGKIRAILSEIGEKKRTEADVMAAAGKVLKESLFFGAEVSKELNEGLPMSAQKYFLENDKALFEQNPLIHLANEKYLFTFEDLVILDDRAIQKVLREVDSQELAKALKNVDREVQDKIFRNMSKRAADMLKEDMEFMGPVRLCDVEDSQIKIVKIIRKLEADGEIVIAWGTDGELVV